MISLASLAGAIRCALDQETRTKTDHQKYLARKRVQQNQIERDWQAELERRAEREADADGALARERAAKAERQEQERIDALAASIVNWQRKRS